MNLKKFLVLVTFILFLFLFSVVQSAQKIKVEFSYTPTMTARTVHLVGTFNEWSKDSNPMEDNDKDGVWKITIELLPGEYQYKFLVDGHLWIQDPNNPLSYPDGHEGFNSVIKVGDYQKLDVKTEIGDNSILKEALYHDQEIDYVNLLSLNKIMIKLRVKRNDVQECKIKYYVLTANTIDGMSVVSTDSTYKQKMHLYAYDNLFDYYVANIDLSNNTKPYIVKTRFEPITTKVIYPEVLKIVYIFKVKDGEESIYYGKTDLSKTDIDTNYFTYDLTDKEVFHTPDWAKNAIFYQIFPDRFCNGDKTNDPKGTVKWGSEPTPDNFMGGDLQGIIDKLPYLKELGITAIYLNPIFEAASNHKYDAQDYMKIDDNFGTLEKFQELISTAHKLNIKIILDGVFNHTGDEFWAFQDVVKNEKNSKYLNWYTVYSFPIVFSPKPSYQGWWGFSGVPELNTKNPEVKNYLFEVTRYWTSQGIDGWRLDVANEVEHEFWKEWRNVVKSINPDAIIIGEIWGNGRPWLDGSEFDAVMNYRLRQSAINFFVDNKISPSQFDTEIAQQRNDYPHQVNQVLLNLISSHDTERYLTICKNDVNKMAITNIFYATYIGMPCIYYGDEIGLTGRKDPECRKAMIWETKKQNQQILSLYKKLNKIRNDYEVLRTGDFATLHIDNEKNVYAYIRYGNEYQEKFIVVLNNNPKQQTIEIPLKATVQSIDYSLPEQAVIDDLIEGVKCTIKDGKLIIPSLKGKFGVILKL